jgi:phosphoribosylglycinamide formyltransferase-1
VGLPRIVVLISGRGSNLAAMLAAEREGALGGAISAVVSNNADAAGLTTAARHGVATAVVDHRAFSDRGAFEAALAETVDRAEPDLVVLAGFMRVLSADFVSRYEGRILNIHPSLLPAYTGLHTHRRALADGATIHGCTVHFVTADLDGGPIAARQEVPVLAGDDEDTLGARVLEAEHRLLPATVRAFCEGRLAMPRD